MTVSFGTTNNNAQITKKPAEYDKNLPIKTAAINTVAWAGIGLGTDYLLVNKLLKIKTSKKEALIVNGLIGLGMGIYAYFKTKNLQKKANVKNADDLIKNYEDKIVQK